MHAHFVSQWTRTIRNVDRIFDKASAFCDAKKIDPKILLNSRLAPDQFHLTKQIQILTDVAKFAVARLTGQEAPAWEDNEETLPQVRDRLKKAIAYLEAVKPQQFEGAEARVVPIKAFPGKGMTGADYLTQWAQPNFYFHVTVAYEILRHNGVELGKGDFLGADVNLRSL